MQESRDDGEHAIAERLVARDSEEPQIGALAAADDRVERLVVLRRRARRAHALERVNDARGERAVVVLHTVKQSTERQSEGSRAQQSQSQSVDSRHSPKHMA